MKKIYWLIMVALISVASCKKDGEDFTPDLGYEFYPDEIGHYVIYDVDSTTIDDFFRPPLITKTRYQIKERVESYFTDSQGREAVRVELFRRDSSSAPWDIFRSYYFIKNKRSVEKVEENLRFIKFVFPPSEDTRWQGNKYIQAVDNNAYLANWEYRITSSRVPATINGIPYASTVSILLRDRETQIQKVFAKEIYAAGVGMIFREWSVLETQSNFDKPWPDRAERGYILKMQAAEHGVE
jgi:hypothetical protein